MPKQLNRWWVVLLCMLPLALPAAPVCFGVSLPARTQSADALADLEKAKAASVQEVSIRADWRRIQPAAAQWNFTWLDTVVAAAKARGLGVTLVLGPAPRWTVSYLQDASEEELQRAKPDIPAYKAYVTAVVKHFGDHVRYQAWERPTPATLLVMPADVQALFRTAAGAAHAVNPTARVIVPEPGDVALSWIADYLKTAHGTERADVLLLSLVEHAATPAAFWQRMKVLRAQVLPATDAPELAVEIPTAVKTGWQMMAASALMQDIPQVSLSGGAESPLASPQVAAALPALGVLAGNAYSGWTELAPNLPCGVFGKAQPTLVLALPLAKTSVTLSPANVSAGVAEAVTLGDTPQHTVINAPASLALTGSPAIITGLHVPVTPGTPSIPVTLVAGDKVSLDPAGTDPTAIHALPYLSGGHFTTETQDGQTVLKTMRDQAPWIYLDIPDGFLYYNIARVPVEVTIRCYGVTIPNKTGFNLYYDAVGGMNNSPWQWIDVGPQTIFTYTVRLNDAIFADREGYDFRINMGGSREPLRVVGVTVRKLAK